MNRVFIVYILLAVPFYSMAQVVYQIDSVHLHTLSNTPEPPNNSLFFENLYNDIIAYGPILDIYGRLINTSSDNMVISALWGEDERGIPIEDISLELTTSFTCRGRVYECDVFHTSPFGYIFPIQSKKGIHNSYVVDYQRLSAKKFVNYRITTAFLYEYSRLRKLNSKHKTYKTYLKRSKKINGKLEDIAEEVLPTLNVLTKWRMTQAVEVETGGVPSKYVVTPLQ